MDHLATVAHCVSRRRFLQGGAVLAGLGLVSGCSRLTHQAQPPKVRRIGHLLDSNVRDETQYIPFRDGLRELGYVEGENLVIEWRYAHNDPTQLPALIADLETAGVEAIVCSGLVSCLAVRKANPPMPTVTWNPITDAVSNGLVFNIARPEGNMTGLAGLSGNQFGGKSLEYLHAAVPGARRVGVLAAPNYPVWFPDWKYLASRLGLDIYPDIVTVQEPGGIESAISTLKAGGVGAVVMVPGTMFIEDEVRARLAEHLRAYQLPSTTQDPALPRVGGLMGYSPNRTDAGNRVAWYVDQILKGAKPADLPMERPTRFELVINLKTAQELGLTIPEAVLAQATEIIQ
jgi:putative ABC transport system substrate-binding protein